MEGEEGLVETADPVSSRLQRPSLLLHEGLRASYVPSGEPRIHLSSDAAQIGPHVVCGCLFVRWRRQPQVANDGIGDLLAHDVRRGLVDRARLRVPAVGPAERGEEEGGVGPLVRHRLERKLRVGIDRRDHGVGRDPACPHGERGETESLDRLLQRLDRLQLHLPGQEDPVRKTDLVPGRHNQHARCARRDDGNWRERQAGYAHHSSFAELILDDDGECGGEGFLLVLG
jgi:hypothetical protein